MLLKGLAISDMGEFMPKSSFHDVFKDFFARYRHILVAQLTACLDGMCSSIRLRLLTARSINPVSFKHITLHLDGHDSRVVYPQVGKASMYSYKLKKSGFRTQVCCDMNSMIVLVSQPAERRDFNDSLIHKPRGIELTDAEKRRNEMFESFRSTIESYFGDIQTTFSKFSHATVNRVPDKGIFALQFKLACLILNIRRMAALWGIDAEMHHNLWMQDEFEYPDDSEWSSVQFTSPSLKVRVNEARSLARLQTAFLNLAAVASDGDLNMGGDNDYADNSTAYEV
ncbi:hypothetical protein BGZ51_002170 [Haplosporangium sp. Z 767]|nr:hypothetical protein BGZ51_002170 [Haplosporangium sp. Z 767]